MPDSTQQQDALHYHAKERPGKIEVVPTKETKSQRDLSLAYTPGVAEPCRAIQQNPEAAYQYTARGNLVAVITNGTAVLGLGILARKPVNPSWKGKACCLRCLLISMCSTWNSTYAM